MGVIYHSTRNTKLTATASQAILKGIAPDGGLYVPDQIPALDIPLAKLADMDYRHVAFEVLKRFLTDYTDEELWNAVNNAYSEKNFDHEDITCLVNAGDAYYLELFHGRTIAFKDMALSILPYLMKTAAVKNNVKEDIIILTATSGDTGKAALAGFDSVPGTGIVVFYPKDGVSKVQERQMVTQPGENTHVIGIRGNFDDAQREVKAIFGDPDMNARMKEAGYIFSSANSINIGRLIPQIAYYVYAYTRLMPESINFVVPTGNFGNILAAYYAYKMGVPIHKLICASNENKVLYDFFETGVYDRNRDFILTSSPSMDILISSNLERLIYEIAGEDTTRLMKDLAEKGRYSVEEKNKGSKPSALELFVGEYASETEMSERIRELYLEEGYIMDPHTAVASAAYEKYLEATGDETCTVIASTASPYKFTRAVLTSIDDRYKNTDDFELFPELEKMSGIPVPRAISDIMTAPVRHTAVCDRDKLKEAVSEIYL